MNNNTGKDNTGDRNSGYGNSGYGNSGHRNSGDWNSGYGNSGYGNSGHRNSGDWNSGDRNTGYGNSGYGNSGDRNSGDWNSGDRNTGYGNSCNRSAGIFCTETPKLYCFNKPTDLSWDELDHPSFHEFQLNKWVSESEMSDEEKFEQKDFHVRGGYLRTFSWKEAWANYWRDCDDSEKARVRRLPNFDAEIFKEITGIDVNQEQDCSGKVVEIDGKKYKLQAI